MPVHKTTPVSPANPLQKGDPHGEGYDAHDTGETLDDNPHRPGSANAAEWQIGWLDAADSYIARG